eukprot:1760882-Karenia_brevis.AAC.1
MIYRGILRVVDYENFRTGNYEMRSVKEVPSQQVYFPDEIAFPFARARLTALRELEERKSPDVVNVPPE